MTILDYIDIYHSTTEDGNMSYRYGSKKEVEANRKAFFQKIGVEYDKNYLVGINDDVMNRCKKVDNIPLQFTTVEDVDALITNNNFVSLSLLTADCLQVVLFNTKNKFLSLLHCGRLQLEAGIIENVISEIGSKNTLVYLGSCISEENYKWDKNIFKSHKEGSFVRKNIKKYSNEIYTVDLRGAVKDTMTNLDLDINDIYDSNIDTYENLECFSHVRSIKNDQPEGRHLTVVKIK